ncbi:MAG TPA: C4-type zinc ribbon domain-containing protein [Longimicrobiales bacterium]|nr:C4-type zinc ribbon domain-containing protein [Longimicrobiales bacterium]
MHPQLEILLQIQDLKSQRRDLLEVDDERQVEVQEFHVNIDDAIRDLDQRISEMLDQLETPIRSRYERISAGRSRAVVPVINGLCYGCFVAIPTAVSGDVRRNNQIRHCDNCGRFLYVTE